MTKKDEVRLFGRPIYLYKEKKLCKTKTAKNSPTKPILWVENAYYSKLDNEQKHFYQNVKYKAYTYEEDFYVLDGTDLVLIPSYNFRKYNDYFDDNIIDREADIDNDFQPREVLSYILARLSKLEDKIENMTISFGNKQKAYYDY